ncbi:MAG TPA: phosphoenolpyruvate carboxylase, partial [Xanthobacteraceae bacterium]|nr:phosphoenolpyruvate carboxylase [Xanthobacteraceae bacterium]
RHRSLLANGSGALARARLRSLRRAMDVFGFHLGDVDLRQKFQAQSGLIPDSCLQPGARAVARSAVIVART